MIPENKKEAVKKSMQVAFGADDFEEIQELVKGLSSALIFKIVVHGKPYLLRIVMRSDAIAEPSRYYGSMQVAAGAALAPPIYYLNSEDRISITGFVEEKPFTLDSAREKMPKIIRDLHSLPKFPYRLQYFESMEGFMEKFRAARLLPDNLTADLFEQYDRIAHVYPLRDLADWVSCHNDLKPENIIFDGIRPWLVDWESAFLNDPYLDLAMVANFVVRNEKEEEDFLAGYFNKPIIEYEKARLFLMQQLLHVYYFTFFILSTAQGKPVDVSTIEEHDFRIFHDCIWRGEISLATAQPKLEYAWVHRNKFLQNVNDKRFKESIEIISSQKSLMMNHSRGASA